MPTFYLVTEGKGLHLSEPCFFFIHKISRILVGHLFLEVLSSP